MSGLTIGSLFSGIGGLELGLERGIGNGAHTVFQVEKDPYCRAVLAKHWPDAIRYEDVRDAGRRNLASVDVLCGGYPCQPFSVAGHQLGTDDERHLWPEFARIIGEMGPDYAVLENVPNHLVLGFGDVLRDLAALGYDAEWSVISACAVGATHTRDRVFVLAYPNGAGPQGLRAERAHARRRAPDRHARPSRLGQIRPAEWWAVEPELGRVAHGVPSRVDRLRALGNAVVPQVAEVVGRLIAEREAQREEAA